MVKIIGIEVEFLELSRDEVFNKLTENGKYSGIVAEEYNGMYLGLGHYIISGTIKMEHSKPEERIYNSWRQISCKSLNRLGI